MEICPPAVPNQSHLPLPISFGLPDVNQSGPQADGDALQKFKEVLKDAIRSPQTAGDPFSELQTVRLDVRLRGTKRNA